MKIYVTIVSVIFAVGVAGCGSLYYKAQTGQTATVKFTNASTLGVAGIAIFDNPHCTGSGKAVSYNNVAKGGSIDVNVDAGKPLALYFDGDRGSDIRITLSGSIRQLDIRRCQAPTRFTPAVGRMYEVEFTDNGAECQVNVYETSSGQRTPFPSDKLRWPGTGYSHINKCVPA